MFMAYNFGECIKREREWNVWKKKCFLCINFAWFEEFGEEISERVCGKWFVNSSIDKYQTAVVQHILLDILLDLIELFAFSTNTITHFSFFNDNNGIR